MHGLAIVRAKACQPLGLTNAPGFHDSVLSSSCLESLLFFLWELLLFCLSLKMDIFCGPRPTVFSAVHTSFGDLIHWCLLFFFLMWIIVKVFIEFVTTSLPFYVLVFWPRGMWDLSCPTRDWTRAPCIRRRSLATGLPGRPPWCLTLPYADSQLQPFPKLHVHVISPVRRLSFDCL